MYRQLEAYNEIIRLIPLLERYKNVKNGWRSNGFTACYDIAMTNYKLENYSLAAKGFIDQMKVFDSIGNQLLVSSMNNNVGLCYYNLRDYKNALKYFNIGLLELKKHNKKGVVEKPYSYKNYFGMVIKGNIADIDYDQGDYEKALLVYLKEQKAAETTKSEYPIKTSVLLKISKTYLALNSPLQADKYINKTINSLNNYIGSKTKVDVYNTKGRILLLKGEAKESMCFFKKATKIGDSVRRLKIARDNMVSKVKYDIEKKDQDLKKAEQHALLKDKVAKNRSFVIGIIFILFMITGYLYYKSRKDKNIIEAQRKILQASVKEKELLLKEVHHRVKNNLQVISGLLLLQSKKIKSKAMLALLEETQKHIGSIATVHEMLYRQEESATIDMQQYLTKLSEQQLDAFSEQNISVIVNAQAIELAIHRAIPVGLILSELLINTVKYAFSDKKGQITIGITEEEKGHYVFRYQDNGKGLPTDYGANLSKTMGFRLIQMLSEEMNGELKINGTHGVAIAVQFSDQ